LNGRIQEASTPEERLAAVAVSLIEKRRRLNHASGIARELDYADFTAAFRPFLRKEDVLSRMDEARRQRVYGYAQREQIILRERELALELGAVEFQITELVEDLEK
jgi:hypothetical protein